jgi:CRP-like cAMP-binding protein/thioredoxin reductase
MEGTVSERLDLVIVGAGPAGLSAAHRAEVAGLSYLLFERAPHLADTIHCYQKRKHVMAEPSLVPQLGELPFAAGRREEVLGGWQGFCDEHGLALRLGCEVTAIEPQPGGGFRLEVSTAAGGETHQAAHVVIAVGTQGDPRKLGAPGEDLPHVSGRLVDPAEVEDEDVVVVGAGDSALEVALALAGRNRVHLVVRGPEIVRAKESLERETLARQANGELTLHLSTTVARVEPGSVELSGAEEDVTVAAQRVYLKIGAVAPRRWLEGMGVAFSGEGREANPRLDHRYQSSVPGLHLIGAVAGRDLIRLGINQGYEVVEHILGRDVEPADEAILRQRLPWWSGTVRERIARLREEVAILGRADPEVLRETFLSVEPREYADGDEIVRQWDYTDSFLVIAGGRVAIRHRPEGGEERQVATLEAGQFFGEMSLISGRRRNATAVSVGPSRVLEIPRKAILKLLAVSPQVKAEVDRAFLIRAFQGYLFPDLAEDVLWPLARRAHLVAVDKGQALFAEGDPGDAFYLLRSGMVKVAKQSGGREIVLSYLVSGNFFGETALLPDTPRTATVSTIFKSELIRLDRADFDAFLVAHPELKGGFLDKLEERRVATLKAEATPGSGDVLSDLIREEVVIGTDALIIDDYKCVRCSNCIEACEAVHDDGQARLSLTGIKFYNLLAPNSCWQCENPLCMLDCPPDAIVRDPRGEVYIKENCIGCGNCEANCPYDNIFMVHPEPTRHLFSWLFDLVRGGDGDGGRQVAVKCDLCRDVDGGPACVRSCPTGAAIRLTPDEYRARLESIVVREGAV